MASKKKLLSQTISEDFTASPEANLEKENSKPLSKLKSILATPNPQASPFCKTPLTSKVKGATLGNLLKLTVGLPDSKPAPLANSTQTLCIRDESQVSKPSASAPINTPSMATVASQKLTQQPTNLLETESAPKTAPAISSRDEDQPIIHRKQKKRHVVEDEEDNEERIAKEPCEKTQELAQLSAVPYEADATGPTAVIANGIYNIYAASVRFS